MFQDSNNQTFITAKNKDHLLELIKKTIDEKGLNCDLNFINVSLITDMSNIFCTFDRFNGDISTWKVSNVKELYILQF